MPEKQESRPSTGGTIRPLPLAGKDLALLPACHSLPSKTLHVEMRGNTIQSPEKDS